MADKPPGLAVHPEDPQGDGTLVNALLQSNRWLAQMETSYRPGVIHVLAEEDRGLVLVAKTEEMAQTLERQHRNRELTFSYRVRLPAATRTRSLGDVIVRDRREYGDGTAVMDIDSSIGDSAALRSLWLSDVDSVYMVLYQIAIPSGSRTVSIGLGARSWLPEIDLYTAPPCSVCNTTKNFLAYQGFWYTDHTLTEPENVEAMRKLRGTERGIPVIILNGQTLVGFNQRRLKTLLDLY